MSIEVLNDFDLMSPTFDLYFVAFHRFLDFGSDFSKSGVDACFSDTSVGGVFDSHEEVVIDGIESYCECTVDDPSFDVSSEVNLAHIVVSYHSIVSWVRRVVSCHVIDRAASRESNA